MVDDRIYIYIRLRLPKDAQDLHRQIKVAAAKAGKTIGDWASEALRDKLKKEVDNDHRRSYQNTG